MTSKDVESMELTFITSYDNWGKEEVIELIPNGSNIRVNQDNRKEFVDAYLDWYYNKSIESQFSSFFKGFYKVISEESIRLLNSSEVMMLICGVDELNFSEMEQSTKYDNCSKNDQTVKWFWEILHEFDDKHKRMFLKFTTGSDRSPIRGLSEINLIIMVQGLDDERLPSAHTCFNHLIVPQYSSKDKLKKKLVQAIENHEGFGLM